MGVKVATLVLSKLRIVRTFKSFQTHLLGTNAMPVPLDFKKHGHHPLGLTTHLPQMVLFQLAERRNLGWV